jgi:hypothetical protein
MRELTSAGAGGIADVPAEQGRGKAPDRAGS